jgi:FixJ family two-component response regulator
MDREARMPVIVWVVDDDDHLRTLLVDVLKAFGLDARGASGADAFLMAFAEVGRSRPQVLSIDYSMPGTDGIAALRLARRAGFDGPTLMLSGVVDLPHVVEAMQQGMLTVLPKPVDLEAYARQVDEAAALAEQEHQRRAERERDSARFALLTARESEVLVALGEGLMNKQVADRLGLSIKTVETHRHHLMEKLELHTAGSLMRCAVEYRLRAADEGRETLH